MDHHTHRVIAVVDDDPGVRDSLRFLLETSGHTVEAYDSGIRFLEEADPARLACLVLDQHMPQMSGLDLLARLRLRGVDAPALLVTSTPDSATARRATELGVLAVIEKPLSQDELLTRIETVMN